MRLDYEVVDRQGLPSFLFVPPDGLFTAGSQLGAQEFDTACRLRGDGYHLYHWGVGFCASFQFPRYSHTPCNDDNSHLSITSLLNFKAGIGTVSRMVLK
jgi:hypothetical protein